MSRNKIYDQFDAAFRHVSASVIFKDGNHVANICFKFPRDGAGRLYCYLHVLALPMVRGFAGGYGYDKKSAAFCDAARKASMVKLESWQSKDGYEQEQAIASHFADVAASIGGADWKVALRDAGYEVLTIC